MKLIIQIPCLNEEEALPITLADLPREVDGFDIVEWLIIDDGSTDRTIEVARQNGVDHIVRLTNNKGWPPASRRASTPASSSAPTSSSTRTRTTSTTARHRQARRADPGRQGRHGRRRPPGDDHRALLPGQEGPAAPRLMGRRAASDTAVADTTSGFRAYNREAALALQVVSKYTYTLETIIQAGKMTVAIDHVPIRTNDKLRESRLFPSMWTYIRRQGLSIFRLYSMYEPLRVFMTGAAMFGIVALVLFIRYAYFYITGDGAGNVQSLILGAVLFNAAMVLAALGVLGDLLSGQRIMLQRTFERVRRVELELGVAPSHYEPGAHATGQTPTTGAASAPHEGRTEEREAVKL
jgi:hypothetical protein